MRSRLSRLLSLFSVALMSSAMLLVTFDAEAKRLGGGRDSGRQSSNVTQRQATPAQTPTQTPAQPAAAPATAGAAGAATAGAAAKSGASRWLGPIAGIAAGLGIAALLSSMGLGAALAEFIGSMLLIALLVVAGLFIWRMLRRGNSPQPAAAGAAAGGFARVSMPTTPPGSSSTTVGMSGSAAPAAAAGLPAGESTVASSATWTIPAGFDVQSFLQGAKTHFVSMQKAWDQADVNTLREFMTDDMLAETRQQLAARQGDNHTEIVLLNAELLGIEDVGDGHLASVRFSGMLREARGADAERFEEVWNLHKSRQGGGWLLAGIQQLN
jgi:predicted lipid-binding transport protein (Tim44 family)